MRLEYISAGEYIKEGYNEDAISAFDCGASSFNTFLKDRMQLWETNLSGVTHFLIDKDEKKTDTVIYAYATLSTIGLLDSTIKEDFKYISGVEIRLFAVHKKYRSVKDENGVKYSHVFFALLLQELWLTATTKISFKAIFLQSNNEGKKLYEEFGFVEIDNYVAPTVDDKIEIDDCVPMLCLISDDLMYAAFT